MMAMHAVYDVFMLIEYALMRHRYHRIDTCEVSSNPARRDEARLTTWHDTRPPLSLLIEADRPKPFRDLGSHYSSDPAMLQSE